LEGALQKQLIDDLSRFSVVRPVEYVDEWQGLLIQDDAAYDYAVSATLLSVEPEMDILIKLFNLETSSLLLERRVRRSIETTEYFQSLAGIVTELSGNALSAISDERRNVIIKQINQGDLDVSKLETFECIVMADRVFTETTPEVYAQAYTCLEALHEKKPDNVAVLTSFGSIIFVGAISYEGVFQAHSVNPDINADEGFRMVKRAVELDPNNALAQHRLSEFYKVKGDRVSALRHAELAYIANPGWSECIVNLSNRLAGEGQWVRALSLAKDARLRTPNHSADYYLTDFAWALYNGDKSKMKYLSQEISRRGHFYSDIFTFLAAVANEDEQVVSELHDKMVLYATRRNSPNVMIDFVALNGSEELTLRVRELFVQGGVYAPSVTAENRH